MQSVMADNLEWRLIVSSICCICWPDSACPLPQPCGSPAKESLRIMWKKGGIIPSCALYGDFQIFQFKQCLCHCVKLRLPLGWLMLWSSPFPQAESLQIGKVWENGRAGKKKLRNIMSREDQYSFCKDHSSLRRLGFSKAAILKHVSTSSGSHLSLLDDVWHQGGNFQAHICHN